jgi:hypothetical protein
MGAVLSSSSAPPVNHARTTAPISVIAEHAAWDAGGDKNGDVALRTAFTELFGVAHPIVLAPWVGRLVAP